MHSVAKIALAVLVGVGIVGGVAYWEHGAFDRLCARGSSQSLSAQDWNVLTEHLDDPKVMPAVSYELSAAARAESCKDSFTRVDDRVGTILARHKTSDDVSLFAIAHMMTRCNEPKMLTWTSRPAADLVRALHDREIATLYAAPPNVLPDMLLRLGPSVDQSLVDVVVASTKAEPSSVDAFWTNGFPPDGAAFTTGGATLEPATDPRQTRAVAEWLWSLEGHGGIRPEIARAMLRILDHVTPPKLDEKSAHALSLAGGNDPDAIKLCQRLARPADEELLRKALSNANDRAACLLALTDQDAARAILSGAQSEEAKVAALIAMGSKADPVLRTALMSEDPKTRSVAEKALAVIDRHAFAVAIARSLRAHVSGAKDAPEIERLLTDPPLELDAWFAVFSTRDAAAVERASAFVKANAKPDEWVPALFAGLPHGDANAVDGFAALLEGTDGAAPVVGAMLSHALAVAGAPEKVDPLTKLLALRALSARGTPKQAAAIEPFIADPSTYDENGAKKSFGALATQALAAVKAR